MITGTNIVRNGFSAPTPLTVIGQDQFQTSATNNIADYLNTTPVFQNSQTPTNQYHQSSNGLAGLNTLNLRSLGSSRTLVLIDGQRSVGSTTTGLVDINNIPQDLVSRVDVVTGGASAVYGSDALTGVVNFVLDKKFTGTKVSVSGGVTTYGDDPNWKVGITEGFGFAGDRGHFIVSGEATDDYGIRGVPRNWNNGGAAIIVNPAFSKTNQNGQPQYIRVNQASLYTATWGGIITNTPLANTTFGPGGTPDPVPSRLDRFEPLHLRRRLGLEPVQLPSIADSRDQEPAHLHAPQLRCDGQHQRLRPVQLGGNAFDRLQRAEFLFRQPGRQVRQRLHSRLRWPPAEYARHHPVQLGNPERRPSRLEQQYVSHHQALCSGGQRQVRRLGVRVDLERLYSKGRDGWRLPQPMA